MQSFFGFNSIKRHKMYQRIIMIISLCIVCFISFISGYLSINLPNYVPEIMEIKLYKPKISKKSLTNQYLYDIIINRTNKKGKNEH